MTTKEDMIWETVQNIDQKVDTVLQTQAAEKVKVEKLEECQKKLKKSAQKSRDHGRNKEIHFNKAIADESTLGAIKRKGKRYTAVGLIITIASGVMIKFIEWLLPHLS